MERRYLRPSPNEEAQILKKLNEEKRIKRLKEVRRQDKSAAIALREKMKKRKDSELQKILSLLQTEFEEDKAQQELKLLEELNQRLKKFGESHKMAEQEKENYGSMQELSAQLKRQIKMRYNKAMKKVFCDQQEKVEEQRTKIDARLLSFATFSRKKELQKTLTSKIRNKVHEMEEERKQKIVSLPKPLPDPILNLKPVKIVASYSKLGMMQSYAHSRYHLSAEEFVEEPDIIIEKATEEEQVDAMEAAEVEAMKNLLEDERIAREKNERNEKADLRYKYACREVYLKQQKEELLEELKVCEQEDRQRRKQIVADIPKKVFDPPYQRIQDQKIKQLNLERAFENAYQRTSDDVTSRYYRMDELDLSELDDSGIKPQVKPTPLILRDKETKLPIQPHTQDKEVEVQEQDVEEVNIEDDQDSKLQKLRSRLTQGVRHTSMSSIGSQRSSHLASLQSMNIESALVSKKELQKTLTSKISTKSTAIANDVDQNKEQTTTIKIVETEDVPRHSNYQHRVLIHQQKRLNLQQENIKTHVENQEIIDAAQQHLNVFMPHASMLSTPSHQSISNTPSQLNSTGSTSMSGTPSELDLNDMSSKIQTPTNLAGKSTRLDVPSSLADLSTASTAASDVFVRQHEDANQKVLPQSLRTDFTASLEQYPLSSTSDEDMSVSRQRLLSSSAEKPYYKDVLPTVQEEETQTQYISEHEVQTQTSLTELSMVSGETHDTSADSRLDQSQSDAIDLLKESGNAKGRLIESPPKPGRDKTLSVESSFLRKFSTADLDKIQKKKAELKKKYPNLFSTTEKDATSNDTSTLDRIKLQRERLARQKQTFLERRENRSQSRHDTSIDFNINETSKPAVIDHLSISSSSTETLSSTLSETFNEIADKQIETEIIDQHSKEDQYTRDNTKRLPTHQPRVEHDTRDSTKRLSTHQSRVEQDARESTRCLPTLQDLQSTTSNSSFEETTKQPYLPTSQRVQQPKIPLLEGPMFNRTDTRDDLLLSGAIPFKQPYIPTSERLQQPKITPLEGPMSNRTDTREELLSGAIPPPSFALPLFNDVYSSGSSSSSARSNSYEKLHTRQTNIPHISELDISEDFDNNTTMLPSVRGVLEELQRLRTSINNDDYKTESATKEWNSRQSNYVQPSESVQQQRQQPELSELSTLIQSLSSFKQSELATSTRQKNLIESHDHQNVSGSSSQSFVNIYPTKVSEDPQVSPIKEVEEITPQRHTSVRSLEEQSLSGGSHRQQTPSLSYNVDGLSIVKLSESEGSNGYQSVKPDTDHSREFFPLQTVQGSFLNESSAANQNVSLIPVTELKANSLVESPASLHQLKQSTERILHPGAGGHLLQDDVYSTSGTQSRVAADSPLQHAEYKSLNLQKVSSNVSNLEEQSIEADSLDRSSSKNNKSDQDNESVSAFHTFDKSNLSQDKNMSYHLDEHRLPLVSASPAGYQNNQNISPGSDGSPLFQPRPGSSRERIFSNLSLENFMKDYFSSTESESSKYFEPNRNASGSNRELENADRDPEPKSSGGNLDMSNERLIVYSDNEFKELQANSSSSLTNSKLALSLSANRKTSSSQVYKERLENLKRLSLQHFEEQQNLMQEFEKSRESILSNSNLLQQNESLPDDDNILIKQPISFVNSSSIDATAARSSSVNRSGIQNRSDDVFQALKPVSELSSVDMSNAGVDTIASSNREDISVSSHGGTLSQATLSGDSYMKIVENQSKSFVNNAKKTSSNSESELSQKFMMSYFQDITVPEFPNKTILQESVSDRPSSLFDFTQESYMGLPSMGPSSMSGDLVKNTQRKSLPQHERTLQHILRSNTVESNELFITSSLQAGGVSEDTLNISIVDDENKPDNNEKTGLQSSITSMNQNGEDTKNLPFDLLLNTEHAEVKNSTQLDYKTRLPNSNPSDSAEFHDLGLLPRLEYISEVAFPVATRASVTQGVTLARAASAGATSRDTSQAQGVERITTPKGISEAQGDHTKSSSSTQPSVSQNTLKTPQSLLSSDRTLTELLNIKSSSSSEDSSFLDKSTLDLINELISNSSGSGGATDSSNLFTPDVSKVKLTGSMEDTADKAMSDLEENDDGLEFIDTVGKVMSDVEGNENNQDPNKETDLSQLSALDLSAMSQSSLNWSTLQPYKETKSLESFKEQPPTKKALEKKEKLIRASQTRVQTLLDKKRERGESSKEPTTKADDVAGCSTSSRTTIKHSSKGLEKKHGDDDDDGDESHDSLEKVLSSGKEKLEVLDKDKLKRKKEEDKKRTKRLYERLPEVQQQAALKARQEEAKKNKEKAEAFHKKLQESRRRKQSKQ